MKTRVESDDLKQAKEELSYAVMRVLSAKDGNYGDIEEAVQDGIIIQDGSYLTVDIHVEKGG